MLGRPVSPRDCALAFAIPLTEAQVVADLAEDAPKDLAKSIRRRTTLKLRGSYLYARYYQPLVAVANAVAAETEALGVKVYRGTRLADVAAVTAAHAVVTLVAHWRFPPLSERDVGDLPRFRAALAPGEAAGAGEERPVHAFLWADPAVRAATTAAELAAALNRLLLPSQRYYQWAPTAEEEWPADAAAAGPTRVLLEETFPGCFAPGLCLEMADRLCTTWEFIDAVPDAFDGVLDLTVCNSLPLAEALRRRRSRCNAVCVTSLATADVRLVIYRHVIRSLARSPEPFEDILIRAHLSLIREIRRRKHEQA
jgi:hypothetical protein